MSHDGVLHPIIFDIDGTLATRSSSHLEAFSRAASQVLGRSVRFESTAEVPYLNGRPAKGLIDCQCFRMLSMDSCKSTEAVESLLNHFMTAYESEYFDLLDAGGSAGELVPGAKETLSLLRESRIPIGLSTGNAHFIAREKLTRLGVDEYFEFDPSLGFGTYHADRVEVVKAAMKALPSHSAGFLVGDTERDMVAAHSNGLAPIGVETGADNRTVLMKAGAQMVLKSIKCLPDALFLGHYSLESSQPPEQ